MSADGVQLGREWPLLPDGEYLGVVINYQRGKAPWAPRHLEKWESELRADWHVYYHVQLLLGTSRQLHTALATYAEAHGRAPVVYYACRYATRVYVDGKGRRRVDDKPLRPASSSNLHRLLVMTRPGTTMVGDEFVPFNAPLGWELKVRLKTVTRDRDRDEVPQALRRSVVNKVLAAYPAGTNFEKVASESSQRSVFSRQRPAVSEQQHSTRIEALFRELTNGATPGLSPSSQHGRNQATSRATAPAVLLTECAAGADEDVTVGQYIPPALTENERRRRRRVMFGRHREAVQAGRCSSCEEPRYARPGENPRCLRCDFAG